MTEPKVSVPSSFQTRKSRRGPKTDPLTQGALEPFCFSAAYILEAPAGMWPEFKHGEAWPLTVSTFVDSGSLFCLLLERSAVCRQSPCCAAESGQRLAPSLSLIWANKSRLLRTELGTDKRLIKVPFVVQFHRSGLGIIFD